MCDQNNLKDQSNTNLKLKGLMFDQNNLKDQFITNLKLKEIQCNLPKKSMDKTILVILWVWLVYVTDQIHEIIKEFRK